MTSKELKEKILGIFSKYAQGTDELCSGQFEELLDNLIQSVVEETESACGVLNEEDSERLVESLKNWCGPEEAARRRAGARAWLKKHVKGYDEREDED